VWYDTAALRNFFDSVGVEKYEDWYNISHQSLLGRPGYHLIRRWHASFIDGLAMSYPGALSLPFMFVTLPSEFTWYPWLFSICPRYSSQIHFHTNTLKRILEECK
jgi:hypothetical protein